MINTRLLLSAFLLCIASVAFCQKSKYVGTFKDYEKVQRVKNSTLMVVIDESTPYDLKLKEYIEANWTFSKFEFIKVDKALDYLKNPKYSALCLVETKDATDGRVLGYSYGIYFGDKIFRTFNDYSHVASYSLDFVTDDSKMTLDYEKNSLMIPLMVNYLQSYLFTHQKSTDDFTTQKVGKAKHYNFKDEKLSDKKILFYSGKTKYDLDMLCSNLGVDKSNLSTASIEEIETVTKEKNEEYAIMMNPHIVYSSSGKVLANNRYGDQKASSIKGKIVRFTLLGILVSVFIAIATSGGGK